MIQIPRSIDDSQTIQDYIPGQPIPALVTDAKTGRTYVNALKKYVVPYTLGIEGAEITLTANQVSSFIPMKLDAKGHFEIVDAFFVSQRTEGFMIELFLPNEQFGLAGNAVKPFLMNKPVHVATIASGGGTRLQYEVLASVQAGRPYRWPETYFLNVDDGPKVIFARFRNLSALSNTVRFYLHGRRWYHMQAPSKVADRIQQIYRGRMRTFPFFYTTDQEGVSLGAGGTSTPTIRFDDVSWTEWRKSARVSTGRFTVRVLETVTDKRLMDVAILDDFVFGSGEFPFPLWEPMVFEPNSKLSFELTDVSDEANTVRFTLGCRKIMFDPKDANLLRPSQASGGDL